MEVWETNVVWDVTCPDTLAPSCRGLATSSTGAVAAAAEERKKAKRIGPRSLAFLKDLGRKLLVQSSEPKSFPYLLQQLSVAVQRGNSASILGTLDV